MKHRRHTPTHPGAMTPVQMLTRAAEAVAVSVAFMAMTAAMLAALIIFS